MHRLLAEQLRLSVDDTGQIDLDRLGELVSAAYEENDRIHLRMSEELAQTHDRAEQDLLRTREFLDKIIENIPIAVFAKDAKDSRYILLNRAGEEYYGLPREQMLGRTPEEIFPEDVARVVTEQDRRVVDGGTPMFLEDHLLEVGVKGHDRVVNSRKLLITDARGAPQYLVGVIEDVTERIANQARISHLAHHDALTDLPNRSAFNEVLAERLARAQDECTSFAVLSLDLDRFKEVNDVFGHPVGDMLMRAAAERLRAETDGAFVARIGGDEFMILMDDDAPRDDVLALAERLVETIGKELEIDDYLLHVGLSVGIAVYPHDGADAGTLLANADSALYRAKREGRGTVRFFETEMDQELRDRRLLQHDLRQALEQNQLTVHFQPQAKMDGEIVGFEALLRWQHPTRGLVPPDRFIPLAEEAGSIAHALNIPVVAEGVETEAQRAFLAHEACEEMQGYLVGRPDLIERYLDVIGVTVEHRRYG